MPLIPLTLFTSVPHSFPSSVFSLFWPHGLARAWGRLALAKLSENICAMSTFPAAPTEFGNTGQERDKEGPPLFREVPTQPLSLTYACPPGRQQSPASEPGAWHFDSNSSVPTFPPGHLPVPANLTAWNTLLPVCLANSSSSSKSEVRKLQAPDPAGRLFFCSL